MPECTVRTCKTRKIVATAQRNIKAAMAGHQCRKSGRRLFRRWGLDDLPWHFWDDPVRALLG
jgi:hypothetical protein